MLCRLRKSVSPKNTNNATYSWLFIMSYLKTRLKRFSCAVFAHFPQSTSRPFAVGSNYRKPQSGCRPRYSLSSLIVGLAATIASVTSPPVAEASTYGAPEGWRDVPDYPVFITQTNGWTGSSGELETVDGHLPIDTENTYENLPSLRFNVTQPNMAWMVSIHVLAGWASHDVSGYLPNGYLEFNVKGQNGGEQFTIGAVDHFGQRRPIEIEVNVPVANYTTVTTEWQHVKIPLKDIFNSTSGINAYGAKAILLNRVNNEPFTVWLNQIKLTTTDKERGYAAIKLNQVGFLNSADKYAKVSGFEDEFSATVGTPFQVRRTADDSVAYAGQLVLVKNYDAESGERVLKAVFTDLKDSGVYYITVDAPGIAKSLNFTIGGDIFKPLVADASRYYFYQRSGIDITAQYHDFPRVDPLPLDHVAIVESDPTRTKDVSKGWFDAGDRGKWMASGASAANTMLWSYEMFRESYADNTNIPESGNGVPDVLDEVRWELEWILKMQDTDGGIYGKVDNNDNGTQRVLRDMYNGATNVKPTNDTGIAAVVLAQASRVYAPHDSVFATKCLNAARLAWTYLEQNPNNIKGPGYTADDDQGTRFGAAVALFRATGEARYNNYVLAHYTQFNAQFENKYSDFSPTFTYADYMMADHHSVEVENWFRAKFTTYLNDRLERYNGNAWGNAINNGNYYWGSNNVVLVTALELLVGSKVLGTYNDEVKNMALDALNYVLGANAMRKSFVTGYGEDSIKTVFSTFNEYPGQGVPGGWIPLGVNQYNGGGSSNFPAKDYLDSDSEWTTNEHSVGAACNLMFIAAFANSYTFTDRTALVRHAPTINGDIDGSLQLINGESFAINSGSLSGDLLLPGTPTVGLNGHPIFAAILDTVGAAAPTNYTLTLNDGAVVRYIVRRVDPLAMPGVTAPQPPAGTRDVTLNSAGQNPGSFATIRNLTLNSSAGAVAVPAGVYGTFTGNGSSTFVLGVAGATVPAVYELQGLTLNNSASVRIVGPVKLKLANGVTLNGSVGSAEHPEWLRWEIASGGLTVNSNATVHGVVTAPNGTVTINGALHGRVTADRLTINGDGVLEDIAP